MDSAGVEVVLNSVTAVAAPVFTTVDSIPSLRLGTIDGRKEEQFGTVTDLVALPDGGVAILDGMAAEVRVFGPDGAYRMSVGSKGQGPGQFQRPIELALLSGDTLALYDLRLRRVTRFGLDGSLGRVTSLQGIRATLAATSFLPDGQLIGQSRWLAPDRQIPGADWTYGRDTAVLTLFTSEGAVADTVDVVPGAETVTSVLMSDSVVSVFRRAPAFGRTNVFAVHPDGVWSSANDRFELRLHEPANGGLVRIVRAPGLEQPVTAELARAVRARAAADAETAQDRQQMEEWYDVSPRPETLPAYDMAVVDLQARVWVRAWSPLGDATRWWVFAWDGELLGSVDVPRELRIVSVGCGWMWSIEQDDLDVSYVTRYTLRGPDDC